MKRPFASIFSAIALGMLTASGASLAVDNRIVITGQVMLQNNLANFSTAPSLDNPALQKLKQRLGDVFAALRKNDAVILELESSLALSHTASSQAALGHEKDSDFFHEIKRAGIVDLTRNQLGVQRIALCLRLQTIMSAITGCKVSAH